MVIVLISVGMLLTHLHDALQGKVDKKQRSFMLSFFFLNPKPCFALHIASLTRLHTPATQFLNTLPAGSALSSATAILLPRPTNASFPSALPSSSLLY